MGYCSLMSFQCSIMPKPSKLRPTVVMLFNKLSRRSQAHRREPRHSCDVLPANFMSGTTTLRKDDLVMGKQCGRWMLGAITCDGYRPQVTILYLYICLIHGLLTSRLPKTLLLHGIS
jgi:hypothetical protein